MPINPVLPFDDTPPFPLLHAGHMPAIGVPIAAFLAETPDQAQDAAGRVHLD